MVVLQPGSLCLAHGARHSAVSAGSTVCADPLRLCLFEFESNLLLLGVGVFQEYYQNNMLKDYSASTISWIPSLQIFFMMGMVSY